VEFWLLKLLFDESWKGLFWRYELGDLARCGKGRRERGTFDYF